MKTMGWHVRSCSAQTVAIRMFRRRWQVGAKLGAQPSTALTIFCAKAGFVWTGGPKATLFHL